MPPSSPPTPPTLVGHALATIRDTAERAIHHFDPEGMTSAAITHVDGQYVGPDADPVSIRAWTHPTIERVVTDLQLVLHRAESLSARGQVVETL